MTAGERARRRIARALWLVLNPVARRLAGIAPWWVVLETTGRRTGKPRQVPLAKGPVEGSTTWLIAVHGSHGSFGRNIQSEPRVRLKISRRWLRGTAKLEPLDPETLARFSRYARMGPRSLGIDPKLVRIELDPE